VSPPLYLSGTEPPFWLAAGCVPSLFLASFSQWSPLLDAPPLRAAASALKEERDAHALAAKEDASARAGKVTTTG